MCVFDDRGNYRPNNLSGIDAKNILKYYSEIPPSNIMVNVFWSTFVVKYKKFNFVVVKTILDYLKCYFKVQGSALIAESFDN